MKRHLIMLSVYVLAGAIVNVAVAWACAVWSPLGAAQIAVAPVTWEDSLWWVQVAESRGFGMMRLQLDGYYSQSPKQIRVRDLPNWSRLADQWQVQSSGSETRVVTRDDEVIAGWPCAALIGFRSNFPYVPTGVEFLKSGWQESRRGRVLPMWPAWPGFAINSVFYAVTLWLLFVGLARFRRFMRLRRRLCPACKYPIGVSDVCTECGKPVPRRLGA